MNLLINSASDRIACFTSNLFYPANYETYETYETELYFKRAYIKRACINVAMPV